MFWLGDFFSDLLGLTLTLTVIILGFYKWSFNYWGKKNLVQLEPSFPFGNLKNTFTTTNTIGIVVKNLYDEFKKRSLKHGGVYFFTSPNYMVLDLDYLKNILTKDFQYFTDRGFYYHEEVDPISAHLFAIDGVKWRNLRAKLSPTFTSGKMKMMFQTLVDCEKNLSKKVDTFCEFNQPVDIKEVLGCFTTDIIGSCAFGLECNTFEEDDSPFRKYGRRVFTQTTYERIRTAFIVTFPKIAHRFNLSFTPKDVSDFFTKIVVDTVEYREKNNYTRKDFMQLLIDMKNNKIVDEEGYQHDGKSLTMEEITAQSFVFFAAGFETSSTTMTFALYELAKNQEIQQKVRDEINKVLEKYDGQITYEAIQEMKYMQQVLDETLRKYPPLPFVTRECVKDFKVPDQDVIIEKGTKIIIPILGIHHDERYYPDPDRFDPERFNEENSKSRHQYAHIPFGEGPRICIGLRFGLMQSKVGLTSLLREYKFTVDRKTQEPLKFDVNSFILTAKGDVWLDAEKI